MSLLTGTEILLICMLYVTHVNVRTPFMSLLTGTEILLICMSRITHVNVRTPFRTLLIRPSKLLISMPQHARVVTFGLTRFVWSVHLCRNVMTSPSNDLTRVLLLPRITRHTAKYLVKSLSYISPTPRPNAPCPVTTLQTKQTRLPLI